jgi:hypothetical protein
VREEDRAHAARAKLRVEAIGAELPSCRPHASEYTGAQFARSTRRSG